MYFDRFDVCLAFWHFAGLHCPHCDELDGAHGLGCPAAPIAPPGAVLTLDRPDPRG